MYLNNKIVTFRIFSFYIFNLQLHCLSLKLSPSKIHCLNIFISRSSPHLLKSTSQTCLIKQSNFITNYFPQDSKVNMKFQTQHSNISLLLGLVLSLICGLLIVTASAHPLSSLTEFDADSVSLEVRAAMTNKFSLPTTIARALVKRDGPSFFHLAIVTVILAFTAIFAFWWYCMRNRKAQQGKDFNDGESTKGGARGVCRVM